MLIVVVLALWGPAIAAEEAVLRVAGMTCREACAVNVHNLLADLPGVVTVEVDYEGASARVQYDPQITDPDRLARGLETAGDRRFLARVIEPKEVHP